jgi:hypothetical protein
VLALPRSLLAFLVVAAGAGVVAGCGQQQPDRDFGTYTDCATVGRISTASDPPGDQLGKGSGPQGDLVGLRLARGHGRLCVEFITRGPIRAAALFALSLRPAATEKPVIQLQVSLLAAVAPEVILDDGRGPTRRNVPGTVGIRGERMSLVIGRPAFATAGKGAATIFDDFRWQARTAVALSGRQALSDCAVACR